jgi:anti-anti-sigma factor
LRQPLFSLLQLGPTSPWPLRARALLVAPATPPGWYRSRSRGRTAREPAIRWVDAQRLRPLVPFVSPGDASAAPVAGATAETDSRITTAPAPLLATLPRRRPRRRAPAERTTVVPLEGDLDEARPRELEADLGVRLYRDTTLVLDLRGATFLGAGAARLLLDLRSQAAASGVRLVLWRPEGQPFRTLRIVRFDRVFELRPASWRPLRSRDWTVAQPERWVDVRAG